MAKKITIPSIKSRKLAEETGWHIGDGSMNLYLNKNKLHGLYSLRGHIKDDFPHYEQRIIPIYDQLFKIKISLNKMPSYGVCGFQVWSDDLIHFKKGLGLPLGKKTEIQIPRFILKNNALHKPFIRGIFDTDGCLYLEHKNNKIYPRIQISNVSQGLMLSLKEMILNLDFRATIHTENVKNQDWNNKSVITIRGPVEVKKWFETIRPANPKHKDKYYYYLNKNH